MSEKIKISYLVNARLPTEKAHGVQIMKMCEAFNQISIDGRKKIEVELFAPWRFNIIKEDVWQYYSIGPSFKIIHLPSLDLFPLVSRLKMLGGLFFWLQSLSFSFSIFLYFLFHKTEVIYSRDLLSIGWLSRWKNNCFFEIHALPKGERWLALLKRLKGIIAISQGLKNELVKRGVEEKKILVAADGVDLKLFGELKETKEDCRQKLGLPASKFIIGHVGQLKTMGMEKGLLLLFEAFKIAQEKRTNLLLCLVGGQKEDFQEYQNFVSEEVVFTGQAPHKLIPCYLKSFDLLVMPFPSSPHYAYFMSPLKMFEYMAAQKPIVSADLPSVREILDDGSTFFYQAGNRVALAEQMETVLENNETATVKAENAFHKVQDFTWDKRAAKIINFIFNYEQ